MKVADGARGTVIIIETVAEAEIETAIEIAITIPGADTGSLAKAIAERSPATKQGAIIVPFGHPLSVLTKLGTPSAGVTGDLEVPVLVPDNSGVPADTPASTQDLATVLFSKVPVWTLW